jgi:hypothetical protein
MRIAGSLQNHQDTTFLPITMDLILRGALARATGKSRSNGARM